MATHSNILAWRIPWTEEPCRVLVGTEINSFHMRIYANLSEGLRLMSNVAIYIKGFKFLQWICFFFSSCTLDFSFYQSLESVSCNSLNCNPLLLMEDCLLHFRIRGKRTFANPLIKCQSFSVPMTQEYGFQKCFRNVLF